jgi:hypothetical protein
MTHDNDGTAGWWLLFLSVVLGTHLVLYACS